MSDRRRTPRRRAKAPSPPPTPSSSSSEASSTPQSSDCESDSEQHQLGSSSSSSSMSSVPLSLMGTSGTDMFGAHHHHQQQAAGHLLHHQQPHNLTLPSLPQLAHQAAGPRLTLIRQTSPSEEKVGKDGGGKRVHVVVKNAPFTIELGLINNIHYNANINLHHLTLDASLVYDTSAAAVAAAAASGTAIVEKKVDYVRIKPLEYKTRVTDDGSKATLEVRLKVLTSQHEDMFFRVKVQALNPSTNLLHSPGMQLLSEPVKVISKPEQLKQREPNRKRTLADMVAEAINRIELQTSEHQRLIDRCFDTVALHSSSSSLSLPNDHPLSSSLSSSSSSLTGLSWHAPPPSLASSSSSAFGNSQFSTEPKAIVSLAATSSSSSSSSASGDDVDQLASSAPLSTSTTTTSTSTSTSTTSTSTSTNGALASASSGAAAGDANHHQEMLLNSNFDQSFHRFLVVYNTLSQEEKPAKIRKLLRSSSAKDTERCSALLDLFSPEGLQRAARAVGSGKSRSSCACVVCPYQKELERIDDFYEGFLGAPFMPGVTAIPGMAGMPQSVSSSSTT